MLTTGAVVTRFGDGDRWLVIDESSDGSLTDAECLVISDQMRYAYAASGIGMHAYVGCKARLDSNLLKAVRSV